MRRCFVIGALVLSTALVASCSSAYRYGDTSGVSTHTFTKVIAGTMVSCGLKTDGRAICWGYSFEENYPAPADVLTDISLTRFVPRLACGTRADGKALCWGEKKVVPLDVPATKVRVGPGVSCSIRADGVAACWQTTYHGQHEPGSVFAKGEEVVEVRSPNGITDASMDMIEHYLLLDSSGEVWGSGGSAFQPSVNFKQISVGRWVGCGIALDGSIKCFGCGMPEEQQVQNPAAEAVGAPKSGWRQELVLDSKGRPADEEAKKRFVEEPVWQLEINERETLDMVSMRCGEVARYKLDQPPQGRFLHVSVWGATACAVREDGALACWGKCEHHLCDVPTGSFKQVEVGMTSACALRDDDHAVCWGVDNFLGSTPP